MIRLVAPTGMTKRPTARTSDSAIVGPNTQPPIGSGSSPSSGSSWAFAEIASALKPIRSDSARATTPRITGQRGTRAASPGDERLRDHLDLLVRLRTATAQVETPRIIRPPARPGRPRARRRSPPAARPASAPPPSAGARPTQVRPGFLLLRAARRLKRSTRPPSRLSFCLPVSTGWRAEQISTCGSGFVEQVRTRSRMSSGRRRAPSLGESRPSSALMFAPAGGRDSDHRRGIFTMESQRLARVQDPLRPLRRPGRRLSAGLSARRSTEDQRYLDGQTTPTPEDRLHAG